VDFTPGVRTSHCHLGIVVLSCTAVEEKNELFVEAYFRTGRTFIYLCHLGVISVPVRGHSMVKPCNPRAPQEGFNPSLW